MKIISFIKNFSFRICIFSHLLRLLDRKKWFIKKKKNYEKFLIISSLFCSILGRHFSVFLFFLYFFKYVGILSDHSFSTLTFQEQGYTFKCPAAKVVAQQYAVAAYTFSLIKSKVFCTAPWSQFAWSKSTIKTLEQDVKYIQS